ncbi:MAG: hypothetical protein ACJAYK_000212 [Crocinitomicaceae bacterium]|jgi:hypothetical protein
MLVTTTNKLSYDTLYRILTYFDTPFCYYGLLTHNWLISIVTEVVVNVVTIKSTKIALKAVFLSNHLHYAYKGWRRLWLNLFIN